MKTRTQSIGKSRRGKPMTLRFSEITNARNQLVIYHLAAISSNTIRLFMFSSCHYLIPSFIFNYHVFIHHSIFPSFTHSFIYFLQYHNLVILFSQESLGSTRGCNEIWYRACRRLLA